MHVNPFPTMRSHDVNISLINQWKYGHLKYIKYYVLIKVLKH